MEDFKLQKLWPIAPLLGVLLFKALFIVYVVLHAGIGLGPDEAQYWTWSQEPAVGYYSKPPGIAWEIWAGTQLFGNTELGVRSGALFIGTLLPLAVYFLGRAARLSSTASFWAAMVMAWSPLGIMASFLAITDGGMVFFWTVATALIVRGLSRQESCSYYLLGLLIGCGALFKWLTYELWIPVAAIAFLFPAWRSYHLLGGIFVSLLGLLPSLIWNMNHEWATFRHVGATVWTKETVDVGTTQLIKGNALDFLGAQAVLFSPVLFILMLFAFWSLWKKRASLSASLAFCGWLSAILIGSYSFIAIFKKMQGNWVDFAYPTAAVVVAWYAWDTSQRLRPWLVGGVIFSALLCFLTFAIPAVQADNLFAISYKINPFRHNVGWDALHQELAIAGYDPSKHFLFSDKYQTTSILSFYSDKQKRAYFFNLQGIRKNQFSFWPGMKEKQLRETGYFVVIENLGPENPKWKVLEAEYKEKLAPYFESVRYLGIRPLFYAGGEPVKAMMLFKTVDYNGKEPNGVSLY